MKNKTFYRLLGLTLFILVSNVMYSQIEGDSIGVQKMLDEYLFPLEKHDLFNGSVLIVKGGEILVNKGYGLANYEHKIENTPNTRFRIASLSKIFTKLAIIQLSERKFLDLDDKLSKYIPDYPNSNNITVRHLLDHSSGIPHLNDFDDYDRLAKEYYSVSEVIELFKDKPLDFEPGEKETYSNSGYVLLVYIIEKASSLDYAEYLHRNIFHPAGMKNTGHDSGTQVIENLANGYMMNLEGTGLQLPLYYNPSIKIGGGSLYSTTGDLYLFSQAYKAGKLSQTTEPLYDQGTYGKSPGYNSLIWGLDDVFITVLANNYNTPIKQVAWGLSNMMLGKTYEVVEIKEDESIEIEEFLEYEGDYKIDEYIETIEIVNDVLIEYENGDKWRGCRLIPLGSDVFFDTCYLEKLTFSRDVQTDKITGFIWEGGDKTIRINSSKE